MAYDFCAIQTVEGRLCAIDSGVDHLNHGSVIETVFFRETDIVSQPAYSFAFDAASAAQLTGQLVLKAGTVGYRFRFTTDTGSFSEPMQETDEGIFFDQLLTISIPKDRPEITWLKQRMSYGRYAVLYRDGNGLVKLLRNQRVKMDLNVGRNRTEYNGHVLSARRATDSPALHWSIGPSAALESIYTQAALTFSMQFTALAEGWQAGKVIALVNEPATTESMVLVYNQSLVLRAGEHYLLNGRNITLLFSDTIDAGGEPGTIHIMYATNLVGTAIGGFARHLASKATAYISGETIALPSAPIGEDTLLVTYNDGMVLRPGVDYDLAGSTITLLFGVDPGADTDTFFAYYAVAAGGPLAIVGWKQYDITVATTEAIGYTFNIPHTPITDSELLWLDSNLLLQEGVHYNLTGNEIEILFELAAGSRLDCWYAY